MIPADELTQQYGEQLAAICQQARGAHPAVGFDDRVLIEAIARHAPEDPRELADLLERLHAGELMLAVAAGTGSQAAISALERTFATTLGITCRRFAGPGHTADDLMQILRTKLFVAEPGEQPAIAQYNGQGSLDNWLRVTAARLFIDLGRRKDRAREAPAGDDDLQLLEPSDLALDIVKAEYRAAVAKALHQAARQLEIGDRHLLRQHLVGGLSIDQIGAVLGIHRATAARRISKAREQLASRTRALLSSELQINDDELAEVFGLVLSKLDLSIGKLLATSRPRGPA